MAWLFARRHRMRARLAHSYMAGGRSLSEVHRRWKRLVIPLNIWCPHWALPLGQISGRPACRLAELMGVIQNDGPALFASRRITDLHFCWPATPLKVRLERPDEVACR